MHKLMSFLFGTPRAKSELPSVVIMPTTPNDVAFAPPVVLEKKQPNYQKPSARKKIALLRTQR